MTKIVFSYLFLCGTLFFMTAKAQNTATRSADADKPLVDEHKAVPNFELNEYLAKNMVYPESALEDGIEGRVIIKFIVTATGSVDSVTVVQGISKDCDNEAIRVVRNMPRWKPGTKDGKPVNIYITVPITFKLNDGIPSQGKRR